MELWIRTQNEGLHKIIGISEPIRVSDMFVLNGDNSCGKKRLGTYKSKERALEVLNEIQEHIGFIEVEISAGRGGELDFQSDIVYKMPEE